LIHKLWAALAALALVAAPPAAPAAGSAAPHNLFLKPFSRNAVNREVARFLQFNTRPGDQVMVVSFERSFNIRQPFTSDIRLAQRALEEMETSNALGQQQLAERRAVIERIETARSIGEAQTHADFFAKSLHNDAENSVRALKELVGSLGGLPGRKALLYVSEGVPMAAGEELFALVDARHGRHASSQLMANRYGLRRQFRELVARANTNRVTFYALDAAGGGSHSSLSAEYGRVDKSYVEVAFVEDANRQEPLMALAEGTGGRAILNTNNFARGLDEVAADLDTYYSLGYTPPNPGDGRYHRVEVKVKRRGLTARYRQGYRDKTLESRMEDGTLAALLYGASVNPLGIEVRLGTPVAVDRGNFRVPVEVRIPLGRIALLPQGDQHHGRLRVVLAALDGDGETSAPAQQPFAVSVPSAEMGRAVDSFYTYAAELLMRRGNHHLAVGVNDELGGESAFVRQLVRVN
jgi:VWFA-related protein